MKKIIISDEVYDMRTRFGYGWVEWQKQTEIRTNDLLVIIQYVYIIHNSYPPVWNSFFRSRYSLTRE
ncbi:MAG: hypothetical protein SCH70_12225, partial [Candidatus Methanoperedens sp.]|nr:hypothetical protein [Candidatus Methanoperedens sp.]